MQNVKITAAPTASHAHLARALGTGWYTASRARYLRLYSAPAGDATPGKVSGHGHRVVKAMWPTHRPHHRAVTGCSQFIPGWNHGYSG